MTTISDDDRAQVLYEATVQYWQHILNIVRFAFAIHVVLFALFLVLQVPVMLAGNAVSVLVYVWCFRAIKQQRFQLAGMLMGVEIIAHAILATWVLGWDSNFYLFVFCVVPVVAFSFQRARALRVCLNLAILLVVVGGFAGRRHMGGGADIAPALMDILGVLNALAATALLLRSAALSVSFSLQMQMNLFQTAHSDSLTNLYTRRRIMQRVRQLGAQRHQQVVSVLMLDIDHFKLINDAHGHEVGDGVLQRVAQAIRASVRSNDMAARWGGEEFLVLMPGTSLADAQVVAERVLTCIRADAGEVTEMGEGLTAPLQVTATVAVVTMQAGEAFRDALSRVDHLLYEGKRAGRDRVMTSA
jgi:diguanylate cyclase (GGDEF)-like protein